MSCNAIVGGGGLAPADSLALGFVDENQIVDGSAAMTKAKWRLRVRSFERRVDACCGSKIERKRSEVNLAILATTAKSCSMQKFVTSFLVPPTIPVNLLLCVLTPSSAGRDQPEQAVWVVRGDANRMNRAWFSETPPSPPPRSSSAGCFSQSAASVASPGLRWGKRKLHVPSHLQPRMKNSR